MAMHAKRLLVRATLFVVAGIVSAAAAACGSNTVCSIDCLGQGGCHYEGAHLTGNCGEVTCGTLVCPGVDGGGSSITLGDTTALVGDPIQVDIFGGDSARVQTNLVGYAGAIRWSLLAEFDTATFKMGTLVASIDNQTPFRPGIAIVQRTDANGSAGALSGMVNLTKDSTGVWAGIVTTDQTGLSATVRAAAAVTCFVPVDQLGLPQNGRPGQGVGVQMAPDTQFQTAFCSQFK